MPPPHILKKSPLQPQCIDSVTVTCNESLSLSLPAQRDKAPYFR